MEGSTQSHHVTHLLGQSYGAELTAGHSELEYWAYLSIFSDVIFVKLSYTYNK